MNKKFVIIIPSYNNAKWYEKNILSAVGQNYTDFRIIYTDDASTDDTGNLVQKFIERNNFTNITLVRNNNRLGALCNIYNMVHSCADDEIIVDLDGDDALISSNVLNILAKEYENSNIFMTYGSYLDSPEMTRGCCKPFEQEVIKNSLYRKVSWRASHLRTRYAWLFKKIKKEDLLDMNGNWFDVAWDCAFQFPCLEMCGENRFSYIHTPLYLYNCENPISDFKIKAQKQAILDRYIRSKKVYEKL